MENLVINEVNEFADFTIIDDSGEKDAKCYLKYQTLYKEDLYKQIKMVADVDVLIDGSPYYFKNFFSDLAVFEDDNGYKYSSSTYKTRFATKLTLLLPKALNGDSSKVIIKRIRFIKEYVKSLNETSRIDKADSNERKKAELDESLNYVAYQEKRGQALFIHIIVSERVYQSSPVYLKRKYTCYWNPNTKKFCKKSDPEAVVKFKKDDYILDKDGNKVVSPRFGSKIRRFNFKDFNRFIAQLKENFILIVRKVIQNIKRGIYINRASEPIKRKIENIKQKRAYYGWNFYNRKCIEEINHSVQFIEYHINYLLTIQRRKITQILDQQEDDRPIMDPTINIPRKNIVNITNLYLKYKDIFIKGIYSDELGSYRIIKTKGVKLPELQDNLDTLIKQFKKDCTELHPNLFNQVEPRGEVQ